MPQKEWVVHLGDTQMLISRLTVQGTLQSFEVVLVAWLGGRILCVARYDCAHGFPHQDVLGRVGGLLYKREFPGLTLDEVFAHAIHDFKANSENYLRNFLAR